MVLTKLNITNRVIKKRALEPEDLRQAFLRSAKDKWGENCPLVVKSAKNGVIRLSAPSAPWRTEMLWSRQEMLEKINLSLSEEACKKITVWWE
ncbi:MAG: hypothetical protein Q7S57_04680 [bacterium]|nr:hypothetical protein [bacterium]